MLTRIVPTFMAAALLNAMAICGAHAQDDHDHDHAGDIVVGITGPTAQQADQLAFEMDIHEPVWLDPVSGLLAGWSSTAPGFAGLSQDEPDEQFFSLGSGTQVRLEIVSIDPGLGVVQSGLGAVASAAGESVLLGGAGLHAHPIWWARSSVLGSDWRGTLHATFKLIDTGTTGYADSESFAISFTNVPEPASLALVAVGGLLLPGRRRR